MERRASLWSGTGHGGAERVIMEQNGSWWSGTGHYGVEQVIVEQEWVIVERVRHSK